MKVSFVKNHNGLKSLGAVLSMSAANIAAIQPNAKCFHFRALSAQEDYPLSQNQTLSPNQTLSQDEELAQDDENALNLTHTYSERTRTLNFLLGDVLAFALEVNVSCLSRSRSCADASCAPMTSTFHLSLRVVTVSYKYRYEYIFDSGDEQQ